MSLAKAKRAVFLFCLFQITYTLMLWMPIFYDYQKSAGLTDDQIFGIQSWYYFSFCFLEVPTGFIADRFGHRNCMLIGAALHVLTSLIPVFYLTYGGFLAHWLLLALSRSLVSGAASAFLYNRLEELQHTELYKGAEGQARAYSLYARVLGFAGVGALSSIHISTPYLLTAAASVVAIGAALSMGHLEERPAIGSDQDSSTGDPGSSPTPKKPELLQIWRLLWQNPHLMLLMIQGIGIFVLTRIVQVNLFQPLLQQSGWEREWLGPILAVNTIFEAITAARPQMLRQWMTDFTAVNFLTAGLALSCIGLAYSQQWSCVFWLTVFAALAGLAYPVQRQVMNVAIPDSTYRASLLSVESVLDRAFCAVVAHQVGSYVAGHRMDVYLSSAGMSCLVATFVIALLAQRGLGRTQIEKCEPR